VWVTVISGHDVPARPAIQISVGERVSIGRRSPDWPAFVFVTTAHGDGWVPSRHLSEEGGVATVAVEYDTTELPVAAGETVEVLRRDDASGWWWCRNGAGTEGWIPVSALGRPSPETGFSGS
jgi:hypothetical protein